MLDLIYQNVLLGIVNMSVTASIIILLVLVARLALKKSPKIFSYMLWTVVLFRLLCPVSFSTDFSFLGLFHVTAIETTEYTTSLDYIPQETTGTVWTEGMLQIDETGPYEQGQPSKMNGTPATGTQAKDAGGVGANVGSWNPTAIVTALWLTGMSAIFAYSIILAVKLRRRLKTAVCWRENIYLSDYISSPFVAGVISPKIYLPSALRQQETEYIILHERHHIKRGDHIVKWLAFLALCIHWFNPLVWVAFILSGKDMEMSCDEAVVKKLGGTICREYSASLLSLATGRRLIAGTPLAFGEGNTKSRIKNVLKWRKPRVWMSCLAGVLCVIVALCCIGNPKGNGNTGDAYGHKVENDQKTENDQKEQPEENAKDASGGELSTGEVQKESPEEKVSGTVTSLSPRQSAYGSVEDIAFYCELAAGEKEFRDMNQGRKAELLQEYDGLLEGYSWIARESADGKLAYIIGEYKGNPEDSPFNMKYCMQYGTGNDEMVWLLYDVGDEEAVNAAVLLGKYPEVGYIIRNSEVYFTYDGSRVLIQPRTEEGSVYDIFYRYLYTPNGREYIADAVSRGISLFGAEEPYLYVYLISERFGEISERISLTEDQAEAILSEKGVKLPTGYGFCASLHLNGETIYYTERNDIPQSVIDLAMERCGYRFATPEDIDAPILEARLDCEWLETPIYLNESNLKRLEEILKAAEFGYVGGCGYGAKLTLTLASGETVIVYKGCDGCDSTVFGSYGGYFIGDKETEEFWTMFGLNPVTKELIE